MGLFGFSACTTGEDSGDADFFGRGGDLCFDLRLVFSDDLLLRGQVREELLHLCFVRAGLAGGFEWEEYRDSEQSAGGEGENNGLWFHESV